MEDLLERSRHGVLVVLVGLSQNPGDLAEHDRVDVQPFPLANGVPEEGVDPSRLARASWVR